MKYNLLKISLLLSPFFTLISCDKDFNSLDSDLANDTHFNLDLDNTTKVVAFSQPTFAVQSNNLPINALGIYDNPIFGKTKSQFVTQVSLATTNPTVGTNITIDAVKDSVYLYIPYFSHLDTEASEADTYILDSIYGNTDSSINLKIYRSGYTLRNFNPNPNPNDITSYTQKYYSDEKSLVESNLIGTPLNNSTNTAENTAFKFSKTQYIKYKTNANGEWLDATGTVTTDTEKRVIKEKIKPGMWLNLDKEFFKTQILQAGSTNLLNNNVFTEYFKGLYFQVEENGGQAGAMAMLDFSKGKVHIQYHSDFTTTPTDGTPTVTNAKRELILNLTGSTVNFLDHTKSANYILGLNNANDGNLYIKGGEGSQAYIKLFGGSELEDLKDGRLINEANLIFYVDNNAMQIDQTLGQDEIKYLPKRIYLYDATNSKPLVDYYDASTTSNTKNNKYIFGGILDYIKDKNDKKIWFYKFRITNHINNLITSDDSDLNENVWLGLSLTESIAINGNVFFKNEQTIGTGTDSQITKLLPVANVMNPLGVVLHSSNSTTTYEDADGNIIPMKLKLQIYYTKPN